MTSIRRALATDFGIWLAFQNLHRLSDNMVRSSAHRAALANYLLLYDQIVIPTGNLQVLPVLRLMLGELVFDELIRSKVIVLARYNQWFGYAGGGAGLVHFKIHAGPGRADGGRNIGLGYFLPLDEAIDVAVKTTNPIVDAARAKSLTRLLTDNIIEIHLTNGGQALVDECTRDVQGSPYLRELMSLKGGNLKTLGNLPGNKLTIFNPHMPREAGDDKHVRSFLRVAFENFILHIGSTTNVSDITGDGETLTLVKAKGQRYGAPLEGQRAFAQIQKIHGVPDIGQAFAAGGLTAEQLLALRDSKHGRAFRAWFCGGANNESASESVERFVSDIGKPAWIDRLPMKSLRFAATSAWGVVEPISGTAAGLADNFLLSKWLPGGSPRLFLKQAKVLLSQEPNSITEPKGRDRNAPCFCGSEKKYKHCHGKI